MNGGDRDSALLTSVNGGCAHKLLAAGRLGEWRLGSRKAEVSSLLAYFVLL